MPYRMRAVYRCHLLVQVSHVAWSASPSVCVCLRVEHTGDLYKMAELIETLFDWLTRVGPRNIVLNGGSAADESIRCREG